MGHFDPKYTAQQKDALAAAYVDRAVRPARRVVELAAEGKLSHAGKVLEPFETNVDTVRSEAQRLRKRRAGQLVSELATQTPADAREALRRRLVSAADQELAHWEKTAPGKRDLERFRQIIRCVREAAAVPGVQEPRPVVPGQRDANGDHNGGRTTGGLAAQIIAADARSNGAAQDDTHHTGDDGERERSAPQSEAQDSTVQTDGVAGAQHSEQVAGSAT